MSQSKLDHVTVLGAGVLGGQIAWHSAFKGKAVVSYDPFPAALDKARATHDGYIGIYQSTLGATDADIEQTRNRLTYSSDLAGAVADADFVIEAVPEVPDIKTKLYGDLAPLLRAHTLLATNSSTLLARDFAEATGRPAKYCALHFANMIWALNVVEVMAHPGTDLATLEAVTHFAIEIGQVPIAVQREQNGYVLNSWLVPLLNSSISLVVNGVATPEDVDRTYLIVNRGATMGPFAVVDMVGMKTAYDVVQHWGTVNNDEQMLKNGAYLKENFLDKGHLGIPTGKGFYEYPDPAFAQPGFLDIPDASAVPDIAERAFLGKGD